MTDRVRVYRVASAGWREPITLHWCWAVRGPKYLRIELPLELGLAACRTRVQWTPSPGRRESQREAWDIGFSASEAFTLWSETALASRAVVAARLAEIDAEIAHVGRLASGWGSAEDARAAGFRVL